MTIAKILAKYIAKTNYSRLPSTVIEKAKECLINALACGLGGSQTPPGEKLIHFAEKIGCKAEASVFGRSLKTSCLIAAFVNSSIVNILDFDDIAIPDSHPTCVIIPTVLSLGEKIKASGKELITAIVTGYEIALRIGEAIRPTAKREANVWGQGTWLTFGSAASSAKLLKLSEEEIVDTLGIAGSNAPVPSVWKTPIPRGPNIIKNNFGCASEMGIVSTLLVLEGFRGPEGLLDGETGFWIMAGSDRCDFEKMTYSLGREYKILNVSPKRYPSCAYTHIPLDATLGVIREYEIRTYDIGEIKIKIFKRATGRNFTNPTPRNATEAQFSINYVVAAALLGIDALKWQSQSTINNVNVLKLARKIDVLEDPEATKAAGEEPQRMITQVEIKAGGKLYTGGAELRFDARWDPVPDIRAKFSKLADGVIDEQKVKTAISLINRLEDLDDVTELMRVIKPTYD